VCATPGQLRAVNARLAEDDESKPDTARIQSALDKCKPGMAVELVPGEGNNAFLSGPLEMRTGVALLVDEGITLFGSRDAALYEIKATDAASGVARSAPGVCGTIAEGAQPETSAPQRSASAGP
jgi:polygalacturonase